MKIGIVCYPSYGGSGGFATSLAQQLAKLKHEIHIISYDVPFLLSQYWPKNITFHQVDVTEYPVFRESPYTISLANKIAEVVNDHKLDIIHAHYAMPHAVAAHLAKDMVRKKVKVVVTLHGTDVTVMGIDKTLSKTLATNIGRSDSVTAVSDLLAHEAQKNFKLKTVPEVIENFAITKRTLKGKLKDLRAIFAEPDEKILIHVSNFRPVKRTEDVIKIFKKVNAKIPSKLILIGDGPDLVKIKRLVTRAKLKNNVHFLGFQLDVPKILSASDLFLFPSEKEGFGLAALEAMACGVPIVGSKSIGLAKTIIENKVGLLSRVGNITQMTKNALDILSDNEKHIAMSVSAIKTVNKLFRPEHIVPKYEALYKKLLKK
jgi:N-acetyl-alpha-D-glucosaminyl L-malate synthase BshA